MTRGTGTYTDDWTQIAIAAKRDAGWRCVRCDAPHNPRIGRCLTVHHLDMDKGNNRWWNLLPLCQACHLHIQARVKLARPWVMLPHSLWFQPYVAGWYASHYAGLDLSRDEVMARLDELLDLERQAVFA